MLVTEHEWLWPWIAICAFLTALFASFFLAGQTRMPKKEDSRFTYITALLGSISLAVGLILGLQVYILGQTVYTSPFIVKTYTVSQSDLQRWAKNSYDLNVVEWNPANEVMRVADSDGKEKLCNFYPYQPTKADDGNFYMSGQLFCDGKYVGRR